MPRRLAYQKGDRRGCDFIREIRLLCGNRGENAPLLEIFLSTWKKGPTRVRCTRKDPKNMQYESVETFAFSKIGAPLFEDS